MSKQNLSQAWLGFDTGSFPGLSAMQTFWDQSPYQFVCYYLQAPCHQNFAPWEGNRASLAAMGWTILITFVGQQRPGNNCNCNNLTNQQGFTDANIAADSAVREGFPAGSYIFLDVEGGDPYGPDIDAYLSGWVPQILVRGFKIGIYCSYRLAAPVEAAVANYGAPDVRFWISGQDASHVFNRDTSVPSDNPSGYGIAWQSLPHDETWGGVKLNIDSSVSTLAAPSDPAMVIADVQQVAEIDDLVHAAVTPRAASTGPATHSSATADATTFRIAVNMAGAISAGAYTAGVLDFLLEALEEWQKAKDSFRDELATSAATITNAVPLHEVRIDAMTGASAGGMCAAISAVMMQGNFQHIRTGDEQNTNNVFYEAWVNSIDIRPMLEANDLKDGPVRSLLDCTIIDMIASTALKLPTPVSRPYVAPDLALFLMLTNIRGVTYPLYTDASLTLEEHVAFYGDKLAFQVVPTTGDRPSLPFAKPLPLTSDSAVAWPLLANAAKATGAFPIFLAPRRLNRDIADYALPEWEKFYDQVPGPDMGPTPELPQPPTWDTLNVDGGMTDNDPMELAYDFLAVNNPLRICEDGDWHNPETPETANCTVLSVSPFPVRDSLNTDYFQQKSDPASIFSILGSLFQVLLSQSRFFGESLSNVAEGLTFNHFMIAPSDPDVANQAALQGSCLGAFGGFFDRRFRKHDFLLGRRNCQRFLDQQFVLPVNNPVVQAGMQQAGTWAGSVQQFFKRDPPKGVKSSTDLVWIPIIPLCGTARVQVDPPARETMTEADLDDIVARVVSRMKAIKDPLMNGAPGIFRWLAGLALAWPATPFLKSMLKKKLWQLLGNNITPQSPDNTQAS